VSMRARKREDKANSASQPATTGGNARRIWKWAAGVLSALVIATVTAIGTGIGSRVATDGGGPAQLISYSAKPAINECGTQLFIPGSLGSSGQLRGSPDWEGVMRHMKGSVASPSVTTVSIQGETSRPVTLTDIHFGVIRRSRPRGGIYGLPCGDSAQGRFVAADLDRTPVHIVASSEDPRGAVFNQRPSQPIRFPWTVSLTDPLLLNIVAITRRCYCIWRGEISWQSGGKSGVLRIDDAGHGYTVVGPIGLPGFLGGSGGSAFGWRPFKFSPMPTGEGD
jgi:hypothetical protein